MSTIEFLAGFQWALAVISERKYKNFFIKPTLRLLYESYIHSMKKQKIKYETVFAKKQLELLIEKAGIQFTNTQGPWQSQPSMTAIESTNYSNAYRNKDVRKG
jgi:hypothetical protein